LSIQFTPDPAWALVLATAALAIFALYQGIEARRLRSEIARILQSTEKGRKKNMIEKMLESIYSPLREILTRAKLESTDERNSVRQLPFKSGPKDYAVAEQEFKQIREIIERFGHYLDVTELLKLRKDLEKYSHVPLPYDTDKTGRPVYYYGFDNSDLDPHREYVERKCKELTEELQK
jgi:hypothetical protein